MKLHLDLLQQDLAIRFDISTGKVSQIFVTWIQLLSHEAGVLIIWPSRQQTTKTKLTSNYFINKANFYYG